MYDGFARGRGREALISDRQARLPPLKHGRIGNAFGISKQAAYRFVETVDLYKEVLHILTFNTIFCSLCSTGITSGQM